MLSSAHLEKDFTLQINPMGIVPNKMQNNTDGAQARGNYEAGPRRQEFDGFTFFGVEDGLRASDEDDSQDGAGATGGAYMEDAAGR